MDFADYTDEDLLAASVAGALELLGGVKGTTVPVLERVNGKKLEDLTVEDLKNGVLRGFLENQGKRLLCLCACATRSGVASARLSSSYFSGI